jgi:release factor family 3
MRRAIIDELMGHESYPSASILMPTHRAHPDNQQDPIRLKNLLDEARQRLEAEVGKRPSWPIAEALEALAEEIDWQTNEDGLALFASEEFSAWYRLPFTVESRVAIDRTFETRDLLYALHRMPRYRVLSLNEESTRLFEGSGSVLEEVREAGFPIGWEGPSGVTRKPDGAMMRSSNMRHAHQKEFFTEIDRTLVAATRNDPLPLVLIGTTNTLSAFERVSGYPGGVALRIEGSYAEATPTAIADLAWPRLQEWLHEQRQAVIAEVANATGANLLTFGLENAWNAAREGRGAKLVVEEGYRQAAILHRDEWSLELVDPDTPLPEQAHLDDAVDELVELVIDKGGEVVFVEEGSLAAYDQVALILRY